MNEVRCPRVLVIDPDQEQARAVQHTLESAGFTVLTARGGLDGLERVRDERPDLVVVGVSHPAREGLRACTAIKQEVTTRLIPVLAVAEPCEPEVHAGIVEAGADGLLLRPFAPPQFLAHVAALLRVKGCYDDLEAEIERFTGVGISLSSERNLARLLERIVDEARAINNADAGSLFIVDREENVLRFQIIQNETMGTRMGGERGQILWPPVPLHPTNVSAYVALTGEIVNIADVYEAEGFDFSGPRRFDAANNYRSKSMLVVPMRNHDDEVIGVLQLINAQDPATGQIVPFRQHNVARTHALASQAGVALTNAQLIHDLEALLEGLINVMAAAIDEKSRYTAGHVRRVTRYGTLLAEAVNHCPDDRFGGRRFTAEELNELRIAGLLHDIGKIVIPEYVVDKATKLQTVVDRIAEVRTRFCVIRRGMELETLERKLKLVQAGEPLDGEAARALDVELAARQARLAEDLQFLETVNFGSEYMGEDKLARLRAIAEQTYVDDEGNLQTYLTDDELRNLSITKGTLLPEEMQIIRNHAAVSLRLLQQIPFFRRLQNVPVYAGDHHEMLDGSGYPNKKKAEDLPLQSRILAIVDIFDALTASDRPYKAAFPLERAYNILQSDAEKGKLDGRLVDLFIEADCYRRLKEEEASGVEAPSPVRVGESTSPLLGARAAAAAAVPAGARA